MKTSLKQLRRALMKLDMIKIAPLNSSHRVIDDFKYEVPAKAYRVLWLPLIKSFIRVKWLNLFDLDMAVTTDCWCEKIEWLAGIYQKLGYNVRQDSPFMDFNEYLFVYRKGKAITSRDHDEKLSNEGYDFPAEKEE